MAGPRAREAQRLRRHPPREARVSGHRSVLDVITLEYLDDVMSRLPAELEPASRRQVAQVVSRVMNLAVYPARLISASPVPKGWMPRVGDGKAKSVLYPDEKAHVPRCEDVPINSPILYGSLARTGLRLDEAARLDIKNVDLEHAVFSLDENKTDDPRAFALEPDVLAALTWWKERAKAEDDHPFFVRPNGTRFRVDGLCKRYREEHLPAAGVTRNELFVGSENKKRITIRVHDLRAGFVTYALAGGRTWVADPMRQWPREENS